MNVADPTNTQCQERLGSPLSSSRRSVRTLAIAALLVYTVALVAPAINDGGLKDGPVVIAEPQRISGLGCLIGATVWGLVAATSWGIFGTTVGGLFDPHLLIFPVVSILFVVSTSLLMRFSSPLPFVRALTSLVCTTAPLHFVLTSGYALYIGSYLWLLAFLLSCAAHWVYFFQTVLSDPRCLQKSKSLAN